MDDVHSADCSVGSQRYEDMIWKLKGMIESMDAERTKID